MQPPAAAPTACYCVSISPHRHLLISIWPNRLHAQGTEIALINAGLARARASRCRACECVCVSPNFAFIRTFNCDATCLAEGDLYFPAVLKEAFDLKIRADLTWSERLGCTGTEGNKGDPSSLHKTQIITTFSSLSAWLRPFWRELRWEEMRVCAGHCCFKARRGRV